MLARMSHTHHMRNSTIHRRLHFFTSVAQYRVYGVREAEAGRDEVRPPLVLFF